MVVVVEKSTCQKETISNFGDYIIQKANKIAFDENLLKDPVKFTKKLLKLKAEMDDMVESCFKNDLRFQKKRDNSFMQFMN